jgi:uncharacterized protein (DUF58 family)
VILVVDVQTSARGTYWKVPAYLELVICAAASVACHALDERSAVGLYSNAFARYHWGYVHVPASRDAAQRTRLLEALARLRGFALTPCDTLIQDRLRALPLGATVVIISAQPDERLQAALLAVRDRGHPVALLTVGEAEVPNPAGLPMHHLGGTDAWEHLAALELA